MNYLSKIYILNKNILSMYKINIIKYMINFAPSPVFLSDVAAFEGAVIALAIPLSLEIISRISERYKSEVISKKFNKEWSVRLLPIFFFINIILVVTLRFFVNNNPDCTAWKILAWVAFIFFLFITVIFLFFFIPILKRYMTDPSFILERLYNEAEKFLK